MKMKLAALLAVVLLGLTGCGSSENTSNTSNSTNSANKPAANSSNATSSTTPKDDGTTVAAKAESTDEVGGTKEGCKCSAAGMKCSAKDGKGCCGKDGECSTMAEGKSSCCAKGPGSKDKACCSTAGKMAMNDKNACNPEQKPATTGKKPS
jgi:hypothetical protein